MAVDRRVGGGGIVFVVPLAKFFRIRTHDTINRFLYNDRGFYTTCYIVIELRTTFSEAERNPELHERVRRT